MVREQRRDTVLVLREGHRPLPFFLWRLCQIDIPGRYTITTVVITVLLMWASFAGGASLVTVGLIVIPDKELERIMVDITEVRVEWRKALVLFVDTYFEDDEQIKSELTDYLKK